MIGLSDEVGRDVIIIRIVFYRYHLLWWGGGGFYYEHAYKIMIIYKLTYFMMMVITFFVLPDAVPLEALSSFEGDVRGHSSIHVETNLPMPSLPRAMGYGDMGPYRYMLLTISIGVGIGAYGYGMNNRSTI